MKSKYLSRKFIVAICGLVLSLVALLIGNTPVAFAGIVLAGTFEIGEAMIDEAGIVKKTINVSDNVSKETSIGDNDGSKDEVKGN